MEATDTQIKKALISIAIEKVLLGMGKPTLEEVTRQLYNDYNCYLPDCYENPQHLVKVLQDLYGRVHLNIIKSINKELEEFEQHEPIEKFLTVMREGI